MRFLSLLSQRKKERHERLSQGSRNHLDDTTPKPNILRSETAIHRTVSYKGKNITVQGKADYTLWYDAQDDLASNLAVIKTERPGGFSYAETQVLGYMGM